MGRQFKSPSKIFFGGLKFTCPPDLSRGDHAPIPGRFTHPCGQEGEARLFLTEFFEPPLGESPVGMAVLLPGWQAVRSAIVGAAAAVKALARLQNGRNLESEKVKNV